MTIDLILRAARSLSETRLRTTLTVAGIAIGIASLFSLMSIAEGIRTRVVGEWLSSGLMTSISVTPQGAPRMIRMGGPRRAPRGGHHEKVDAEPHRALDDDAAAEVAKLAGVRRVWPIISRPVELSAEAHPAASSASEPATSDHNRATAGIGPGELKTTSDSKATAGRPSREAGTVRGSPAGEDPDRSSRNSATREPSQRSENSRRLAGSDRSNADLHNRDPGGADATVLRGLDTDFFWNEDYLKIVSGGPLSDVNANQALLSAEEARQLGFIDTASAVGKTVLVRWREPVPDGTEGAEAVPGIPFALAVRSEPYRVLGVFENRGALTLRSAGIIVPTARAKAIATLDVERLRSLFLGGRSSPGYPGLDVYLTPGADLEATEKKIREMGFDTLSGAEIVSRIRRSILYLQAFLGGLAAIAIAVATLGIANTLLTAVYERMREIGVLKAVGARRRDIRRQFFAEAGLIGAAGGVIGIVAGFGADHLLALVVGEISRRQGGEDPGAVAVHTATVTLGCLAFSIALSLLAGTYPAVRAARLDPVVTLRHE